ncbi:DMT family transporter [Eggerthella sp. NSJ-70]|uniref:DMT family transporter n=1 Tax=Eggerthella hominis TaxID=2763043 RepID=A0ABR7BV29_9ACTN|nr:DMT family transporter [Eggerthella hominis]MBC5585437.1 DMT family transporter [Eggerthella hominis]
MQTDTLKYSGIVFLAGASYGAQATTVKITYAAGFTWTQVVASQALFAALLFAAALLVQRARGTRLVALSPKQVLALVGLGLNTCIGTVLYNYALTLLPVSVAITLLFQFTWMGIVVQLVVMRRRPRAAEAAAAVVILGGTLLASRVFSSDVGTLDPVGVACGLLSALSCTFFMFFSSRVGRGLPPIQRGLVVCLGACALGFALCPDYFASGALQDGIWKYGLILGLCALFVPVVLFGIATPHLTPGLSAIMASSELPCGIALSTLVIGEPVEALQIVGIVGILAGIVISQLPHLRARVEPASDESARPA